MKNIDVTKPVSCITREPVCGGGGNTNRTGAAVIVREHIASPDNYELLPTGDVLLKQYSMRTTAYSYLRRQWEDFGIEDFQYPTTLLSTDIEIKNIP